MDLISPARKSHVEHGVPYFWTATINGWKHLMAEDCMKMEVVQSLQWLTKKNLAIVCAYVIIPNHLHLIWTIDANNRKESPQGSLLKFTAHQFRKILIETDKEALLSYRVEAGNKFHEFWQRDSLAIPLYNRPFLMQKLLYIHNNPVAKNWKLAETPAEYRFSSVSYYETGIDEFGILTHIADVY